MVPCFAQTSFARSGRAPTRSILTHGVYAKGLPFNGPIYKMQWDKLVAKDPSVLEGSTNKHQAWEVTDPERWVPHGYALARVDSRGAGWSPGVLWPRNPLEFDDIANSVEWAGTQPWSTGQVGILGISYYAVMGWAAAERQPEHLAALIAWEGFTDSYRDAYYHGGILSEFTRRWQERQINPIQYGQGERAPVNPNTGQSVAGPVTLPEDELAANRQESFPEIKSHPLFDDWHRDRAVDLSRVSVPFLSAANWGGQGIHPRGNFNGFVEAASQDKWLEAHGDTHWTHFYSAYGRELQKRFFDHFLKGEDNGFDRTPRVQLNIRHPGERFVWRGEDEWPLARTRWTEYHLHPDLLLSPDAPTADGALDYEALGDGLAFTNGAVRRGDRDHRPVWQPSSSCPRARPTPTSSSSFNSSIPTGTRSPSRDRPTPTPRSPMAGSGPATAPSTRIGPNPGNRFTPTTGSNPGAGRGLRARHRDRPHLHRRPRGIPARALGAGEGL